MTKQEFIDRTKMHPTDEEFANQINVMYSASGENIDKDTFCADYKKHHDSILLNVFYERCFNLSDKLDVFRAEKKACVTFFLQKAQEYKDYDMYQQAVRMVGMAQVIKRKLELNLELWAEDKDYIIDNIK